MSSQNSKDWLRYAHLRLGAILHLVAMKRAPMFRGMVDYYQQVLYNHYEDVFRRVEYPQEHKNRKVECLDMPVVFESKHELFCDSKANQVELDNPQ